MDFTLSDDRRQLVDSLKKLLSNRYDFQARSKYALSSKGWSEEIWAHYADLGLLGISFPSEYGGFDGNIQDLMLISEIFGGNLILEPWLSTIVLGGMAIVSVGTDEQKARILPKVAEGKLLLAWAHYERGARHDLFKVNTSAELGEGSWRISGNKFNVLHGCAADELIVSAQIVREGTASPGIGLFLVRPDTGGVERRPYKLVDQTCAAEITFTEAKAELVGLEADASESVRRLTSAAVAVTSSEALGAMEGAFSLTVEYLKTRKQFGKELSHNQALQHRAVEMLMAIEEARSIVYLAGTSVCGSSSSKIAFNSSAAKMLSGRNGRFVALNAIQLHGGIGMTEEYAVGHFLRRLTVLDQLFGDSDAHLKMMADRPI